MYILTIVVILISSCCNSKVFAVGGMGGKPFKDILPSDDNLHMYSINIDAGTQINGIQVIYKNIRTNKLVSLGSHGTISKHHKQIKLTSQDCIQRIDIITSRFKKKVFQLIIYLNNQKLIYGSKPNKYLGQKLTTFKNHKGCIRGFLGRSGQKVDKLGPIYQIGTIYKTQQVGAKGGHPFKDKTNQYTEKPYLIAVYADNNYLNSLQMINKDIYQNGKLQYLNRHGTAKGKLRLVQVGCINKIVVYYLEFIYRIEFYQGSKMQGFGNLNYFKKNLHRKLKRTLKKEFNIRSKCLYGFTGSLGQHLNRIGFLFY